MAYIGKSPDGTGVRSRFYYTQSSGGGTSVTGSSDDGTSLAFSDGAYVDVFLNGVLLVAGTDYNTSTANTIAGLAALASGDVVEVVVYDIFTVADTVSSLNGGTFSGNVVFSGTTTGLDLNGTELVLDADADTSITADTDDQIDFKTGGTDRMHIMSDGNVGVGNSTITTGTLGPSNTFLEAAGPSGGSGTLVLSRDTTTDNDEVGGIRFVNRNNADDDGLDADGKLSFTTVSIFEAVAQKPVDDMVIAQELSAAKIVIDPDQDVLGTSEIAVTAELIPVGIARKIVLKIGFTTALSE